MRVAGTEQREGLGVPMGRRAGGGRDVQGRVPVCRGGGCASTYRRSLVWVSISGDFLGQRHKSILEDSEF